MVIFEQMPATPTKRQRILERDGYKCFWCRRPLHYVPTAEKIHAGNMPKRDHWTELLDDVRMDRDPEWREMTVNQRRAKLEQDRLDNMTALQRRKYLDNMRLDRKMKAQANPSASAPATLDHLIPRAHGGQDQEYNLVASCMPCNGVKGNMLPDEWIKRRDLLPEQIERLRDAEKRWKRRQAEISHRPTDRGVHPIESVLRSKVKEPPGGGGWKWDEETQEWVRPPSWEST